MKCAIVILALVALPMLAEDDNSTGTFKPKSPPDPQISIAAKYAYEKAAGAYQRADATFREWLSEPMRKLVDDRAQAYQALQAAGAQMQKECGDRFNVQQNEKGEYICVLKPAAVPLEGKPAN